MLENITSGEDYSKVIIENIINTELELPKDEQASSVFLTIWFNQIKSLADETYSEYMKGNRDTFIFDEDEFKGIYERAQIEYIQNTLNNMVDKDLLEVSVGEDGEILYGLSGVGKIIAENLRNNNE